jgi:hypothetical protein
MDLVGYVDQRGGAWAEVAPAVAQDLYACGLGTGQAKRAQRRGQSSLRSRGALEGAARDAEIAVVRLSLEEAAFLALAVGCLQVRLTELQRVLAAHVCEGSTSWRSPSARARPRPWQCMRTRAVAELRGSLA